jgi:hypothetical protein
MDIRPIGLPVVRAQATHAYAGAGLNGLADARRHTTSAPIRHSLGGGADGLPKRLRTTRKGDCFIKGFTEHGAMINAPFSPCQQIVVGASHTPCMGEADKAAWSRVDVELKRRGVGLTWLADAMGSSIQRVQNWTTRGLPPKAYGEVAAALDETLDWIAGLSSPKWREAPTPLVDQLSPAAIAFALYFDRADAKERQILARMIPVDIDITRPAGPLNHLGGLETGLGDLDAPPKRRKNDV